jgi:hypothetical protein
MTIFYDRYVLYRHIYLNMTRNGGNKTVPTDRPSAVGPLLNLEAARQGRSMLFSDEQNLLLKEGKRGLLRIPKWIL